MPGLCFRNSILALLTTAIVLAVAFAAGCGEDEEDGEEDVTQADMIVVGPPEDYNPQIDPVDFVDSIDNKYYTLTPGTTFIYELETEEGTERIEVQTTDETREVMGVTTTVVWDRVWLDGELIEDTRDWFAQDREGNVWYFGEESKELEDGVVESTEGSWEAGIDGALPGIIMKADPQVGDTYRQEYYQGEAEDLGEVLALGESVTVPTGSYANCLRTRDWNPLEPEVVENKLYCAEVGSVVLEIDEDSGERVELIEIRKS